MKIGKLAELQQTELLRAAQSAGTRQAGSAGDGKIEQTTEAAKVKLSDTSRSLAAEAAGGGDTVRAAKVEEVRKAIGEGRFHVDAAAVADKMITQAAELLETLSRPK